MKPFDLQKAIEGHPLCTRDGRDITEFHYFKTADEDYICAAVVNGGINTYDKNGLEFGDDSICDRDIFLKSEKKKLKIHVCKIPEIDGNHRVSIAVPSNEDFLPHEDYQTVEVEIDI